MYVSDILLGGAGMFFVGRIPETECYKGANRRGIRKADVTDGRVNHFVLSKALSGKSICMMFVNGD